MVINIDTGNGAFDDDNGVYEIARILREYSDSILDGGSMYKHLKDINGNRVGSVSAIHEHIGIIDKVYHTLHSGVYGHYDSLEAIKYVLPILKDIANIE